MNATQSLSPWRVSDSGKTRPSAMLSMPELVFSEICAGKIPDFPSFSNNYNFKIRSENPTV